MSNGNKLVINNLLNHLNEYTIQDGKILAYIITNHDAHSSEYLADCDKRLAYISNFTGSAGTAIITPQGRWLWTDPRYFIQANLQLDKTWELMEMGVLGVPTESEWLSQNLAKGSVVGGDAKLMPYPTWINIKTDLEKSGIKFIHLTNNLVDQVWENRPRRPENPIKALPIKYTGQTAVSKIEKIRKIMSNKKVDVLIITTLDEIAWTLNLRGCDIPYNPVFFAFMVLTINEIHLFVHEHKLQTEARNQLNSEDLRISLHSYDEIYEFVYREAESAQVDRVWIPSDTSYYIYDSVPQNKRFCEPSPIAALKAIKNETEAQGMINAHIKDGIALCRFFHWLEEEIKAGTSLTEISVADKLESFRTQEEGYVGLSFPTISSVGPNAAITHYLPSKETNLSLSPDKIYLCDSGAQFLDGTTDVTRTVHYGNPTDEEKEAYTRVFQGLVALTSTIFPTNIIGNTLDSFARRALWNVGLDYGHGTGHGIGSYLCVHEGPSGISWRPYPDDPGLQENMFMSNEPGFYKEGSFGIRIENIVQIIPAKTPYNFQNRGFLTFSTITMCPIQSKMLIFSKLTKEEIAFLNAYHFKVSETLGPILLARGLNEVHDWLLRETCPIS